MEERKMSLEEAVEKHRALWRGVAETIRGDAFDSLIREREFLNVETFKSIVMEDLFPKESTLHNCFLCDYAVEVVRDPLPSKNRCQYCPLFDPEGESPHLCLNSHFSDVALAISLARTVPKSREVYRKEAYEAALKIAELPIINRKGEEINE